MGLLKYCLSLAFLLSAACSSTSSIAEPSCSDPDHNRAPAAGASKCQDVFHKDTLEYSGVTFKLREFKSKKFVKLESPRRLSRSFNPDSAVARDLDTVWDLKKFNQERPPERIGRVPDKGYATHRDLRVLDMPIKMKGDNEFRLPEELAQFAPLLNRIISHERAMLGDDAMKKYYAYLTVDQGWVEPGATQRKPGAHVDGFQGSRITEKNEINHSYIVTDGVPTVFYPQKFDFSHLDEARHDFFKEMDRVADESKALQISPNEIYLMDAYTVHRASLSDKRVYRTFVRLSFDVKEFDRLGNTHNPHFDYNWDMLARDAHSRLIEYKPIESCLKCGLCPRGRKD